MLRADAYLGAGGFPHRARGEDVALVQVLRQDGVPIASSRELRVRTSARTRGRAGSGLGALLARIERGRAASLGQTGAFADDEEEGR
ncbi:hypothetical protein [Kytococcus sp. Marseille-QA3725]